MFSPTDDALRAQSGFSGIPASYTPQGNYPIIPDQYSQQNIPMLSVDNPNLQMQPMQQPQAQPQLQQVQPNQAPQQQATQVDPSVLQHIQDVISQLTQTKQAQSSGNGGLLENILSQRFQPTLADAARSTFETNQQDQYVSPETIAMQSLAPYSGALDIQKKLIDNSNASMLSGLSQGGFGSGGQAITGDDYINTLNPAFAAHLKAINDGREPYPTGQSAKSPMGIMTVNALTQAYPGFDATTWAARNKTAKDLAPGGAIGQKVTQAETAINHLAAMMGASPGVGGVDAGFASPAVNNVLNYFKNQNQDVLTYNRFSDMSGDEIAKFVAGSDGGTEADRFGQKSKLSINNSPDARKAAAQAAVQAVFGKLEPMISQVNQVYGTNKTVYDFLSTKGQKSLTALGMVPDSAQSSGQAGNGQAPSASAAQNQPQDGATATNPQTGQKIVFKNGQWVAQ